MFKQEFLRKFDPNTEQGGLQLFHLQQEEHQSLEDYHQKYFGLTNMVYKGGSSDDFAFHCFVRGLGSREMKDKKNKE